MRHRAPPGVSSAKKLDELSPKSWATSLQRRPLFHTSIGQKPSELADAHAYAIAIRNLRKEGKWEEAVELLPIMLAKGIKPDVYTFVATISALGDGCQWQQALQILNNMQRLHRVKPNVFVYNAAMNACVNGKQWQKALQLLGEMRTQGL